VLAGSAGSAGGSAPTRAAVTGTPAPSGLSGRATGRPGSPEGPVAGLLTGTYAEQQAVTDPVADPVTDPGTHPGSHAASTPLAAHQSARPSNRPGDPAGVQTGDPTGDRTSAPTSLEGAAAAPLPTAASNAASALVGAAAVAPGVLGAPAVTGPAGHSAVASARVTAVLDQVLPAVPRVVQRGDGTSRLTLKLHPDDLGEVRLTVTVRARTVDVTLAAGPEARAALSDGSARLRSLLEGIGHTTGDVTLRDLSGAVVAPAQGGLGQGPAGQGSARHGWSDQAYRQPDQSTGQSTGQGTGGSAGQLHDGAGRQPPSGHPSQQPGPMSDRGSPVRPLRTTGVARQQPGATAGLDVTI
jgi:hypothetical protein